jgi:hypothetical protein
MVDRAYAAWTHGHITGVLLMDIKAAFPSVAKGRLVNLMKVRKMDGDLIRWKQSVVSERTVLINIEANAIKDTQWKRGSRRAHLCHRIALQYTPLD